MDAWKDVNDPNFAQDFRNWAENHENGYTAMGKPIEGTEATPARPNPDFTPNLIPKDKADLLNAMMGDTSAATAKRNYSPESPQYNSKADKQALAAQNSPYWEPSAGESNRIRAMLGDESKLLESAYETLRPELIDNVRTGPVADEQTLRPSGFRGDRSQFGEQRPKSHFAAAGFKRGGVVPTLRRLRVA